MSEFFSTKQQSKHSKHLRYVIEASPGSYVEVTQLRIFVPDAKMELLMSFTDRHLPRSNAKYSDEKTITRNKETAMGDRTWTFGDCVETDFSRVFFVKKTFSSWHKTDLMISTQTSNAAGLMLLFGQ